MAFILRNGIWRPNQVPLVPIDIDYSHALARGLKLAALGRSFRDEAGQAGLLTGNNGTFAGRAMDVVPWKNGSAYFFFNSPYMYRPVSGVPHFPLTLTFSTLVRNSGGGLSTIISSQNGSNFGWSLAVNGSMQFTVHGVSTYNSSALPYDTDLNLGLTWDGSTVTFYRDGLSLGTVATGAGTSVGNNNIVMGIQGSGGDQFYGYAAGIMVRGALFSADEMRRAALEPFAFCKPKISRQFYFLKSVTGGGTVYNVGITEAASAADIVSNAATLPAAIAEAPTAADTVNNVATLPAAIAEAPAAADTVSNTAALPSAIVETGAAADTVNNGSIYSATIAEAPTAADIVSNAATLPAAIAEAGSATNTQASTATLPGTVAETAGAADAPSSTAVYPSAVAESAPITDTESTPNPGVSNIVETMTATDIYSASVASSAAVVETTPPADTLGGALILPAAIAEAASAADQPSAKLTGVAAIAEAANAQDSPLSTLITQVAILEAASLVELVDVSRAARTPSKCDSLKMPYAVRSLSVGCDCA